MDYQEFILGNIKGLIEYIPQLDFDTQIEVINEIKKELHEVSPFKNEPVDCVLWVKSNEVVANDYNPNKVAPPEMELLEVSIVNDGYTQPIVAWNSPEKEKIEVIDGFHRNRVGKESNVVKQRVKGYLPIVNIRKEQSGKNDRIASTIRHNRARGKHQVDAMSDIVIELKNRNWTNEKIAKNLGMCQNEILRLCQISGLEYLFSDKDFSKAWESADFNKEDFIPLKNNKIKNIDNNDRIYHTYDKWECYKAGFYKNISKKISKQKGEAMYAEFLSDYNRFKSTARNVINEWKYSCEHFLTNTTMNRIAWIGQASMCYAKKIPSSYCSGFNLLSENQQKKANNVALGILNEWLVNNNRPKVTMKEAM
jgi:ParB-like chromosome segregation protein Spo0J